MFRGWCLLACGLLTTIAYLPIEAQGAGRLAGRRHGACSCRRGAAHVSRGSNSAATNWAAAPATRPAAPQAKQAASHSSAPLPAAAPGEVKTAASVDLGEAPSTPLPATAETSTEAAPAAKAETQQETYTDYYLAMREAAESRKLLFVYFYDDRYPAARKAFETETLDHVEIREKLKRFVVLTLPREAEITVEGRRVRLLGHGAFSEMLNRQGVAIIDLAHERADYYGHVVSTFPFTPGKYYRRESLSIILDLPPGTLTQRTMIYAVRIHPERPASTQGQFHTALAEEASKHADHQAAILLQGHHSWDSRFHRINARLPNGVLAQEVVAESWPNESLVEACVECVHSWRQSPGHWSAVRSRHPLFGFDIKRGRNGIWYATGIFGRR